MTTSELMDEGFYSSKSIASTIVNHLYDATGWHLVPRPTPKPPGWKARRGPVAFHLVGRLRWNGDYRAVKRKQDQLKRELPSWLHDVGRWNPADLPTREILVRTLDDRTVLRDLAHLGQELDQRFPGPPDEATVEFLLDVAADLATVLHGHHYLRVQLDPSRAGTGAWRIVFDSLMESLGG